MLCVRMRVFEDFFFTIAIFRTAVTSGACLSLSRALVRDVRCANVKYFSARFSCHKIVLFHFQLFLSLKHRLACAKDAGRR